MIFGIWGNPGLFRGECFLLLLLISVTSVFCTLYALDFSISCILCALEKCKSCTLYALGFLISCTLCALRKCKSCTLCALEQKSIDKESIDFL